MKATVVALFCALSSAVAAADGQWQEVRLPPRTQAEWVTDDATVNGLPIRLQRFRSELTPPEVLTFYEREWAHLPAGAPRRVDMSAWIALSTQAGGWQVAVQVRAAPEGRGSEGLISWGNVRGLRADLAPSWLPHFADHRIAQRMASTDGPVRSEQVTLVSKASFEVQVRRWREHWQRQGWRTVFDRENHGNPAAGRSWLASFERPPQSVDLVVSWQAQEQRAVITVNLLAPASAALTR